MVLVRRLIMVEPLVPMDLQVIPRRAIRQQVILWELIRLLADLAGASAEVVALAEVEVVAGDSGGKLKQVFCKSSVKSQN